MRTTTRTSTKTTRSPKSLTTGKVWTSQHRKTIRALTVSSTPTKITTARLQSLLTTFRARVKKLAKSLHGKKRH